MMSLFVVVFIRGNTRKGTRQSASLYNPDDVRAAPERGAHS